MLKLISIAIVIIGTTNLACTSAIEPSHSAGPINESAESESIGAVENTCPTQSECIDHQDTCMSKVGSNPTKASKPPTVYTCSASYYACLSEYFDCNTWPFLGCLYECDSKDSLCLNRCGGDDDCINYCEQRSKPCTNRCNKQEEGGQ